MRLARPCGQRCPPFLPPCPGPPGSWSGCWGGPCVGGWAAETRISCPGASSGSDTQPLRECRRHPVGEARAPRDEASSAPSYWGPHPPPAPRCPHGNRHRERPHPEAPRPRPSPHGPPSHLPSSSPDFSWLLHLAVGFWGASDTSEPGAQNEGCPRDSPPQEKARWLRTPPQCQSVRGQQTQGAPAGLSQGSPRPQAKPSAGSGPPSQLTGGETEAQRERRHGGCPRVVRLWAADA